MDGKCSVLFGERKRMKKIRPFAFSEEGKTQMFYKRGIKNVFQQNYSQVRS